MMRAMNKASRAIILQHAAHMGPGRVVPVLRDFGIQTEVRHLYKGDEVPTDLDEVRVLVCLGGPFRVSEMAAEGSRFPYLGREVETLQRMVAADRTVLGIGQGAELLAHAAGARVSANVKMGPPGGPGQPPKP